MMAMRLVDPTGGQVLVNGDEISRLESASLKSFRRQMQMVFQDSYSALDPMMTLGADRRRAAPYPRPDDTAPSRRSWRSTGSRGSGSTAASVSATRTSFPAGSGSASRSPAL